MTRGDQWLGRVVGGRYELRGVLGSGGMGTVYEAEQLGLGRTVALKMLHPHISRTPGAVARFQREARLMARLQHPGAVRVFDHGQEGDELYLAMEHLEGQALDAVLDNQGLFAVKTAVEIAVGLLEVLDAAHGLGMVHRDLKPSNVMLLGELGAPRVKVLDFGLATLVHPDENTPRVTETGQVLGTPAYMAPEQCRGEPSDARADLYSVGCLLHELLVGRPPFGDFPSVDVMSGHLYRPPPPVRQVMPERGISEALEEVLLTCLAKPKAQRPASARELSARLRDILNPSRPRSPAPLARPAPSPSPSPDVAPAASSARPVAVLEPGGAGDSPVSTDLKTALAVAGHPVMPWRAEDPLEGVHALVVVARGGTAGEEALALAGELVKRPQAPPVLLCASGDDLSLMSRAIASGVYDYVPWPVDPTDLARKVGRALRSRARRPG